MKYLAPLSLLLLFTGCIVPSLHPLYTESDLIFDQKLLGEWVDENSDERLLFTQSGEKEYRLIFSEKDSQCEFEAHLLKIENHMFLDLFPIDSDREWDECYILLPTHLFVLVKQIDQTLQLASLDSNWLKNFLKENPGAIRHENVDDKIVLTASPRELQRFLNAHVATEGAFDEQTNMARK